MSCLSNYTLRGVFNDCRANLAGVKRIYLTYWDDVVPQVDYTTHTITGYTLEEGAAWYRYDFAKNTASLTSTLTKDDAAGLRYYTNAISASFSKMDKANHLEFMALAAEKLAAVIVTNNGDSWYVGLDGYLGVNSQEAGTGVGADDKNGYTVSLDCNSRWLPFKFTADIEEKPEPPGPTLKYVQDLIDEGYARVVPGPSGNYIEILSGNPYGAEVIVDLWDVAFNEKHLSANTNNAIVWTQPPSSIDPADIRAAYDGEAMNFTPRGGLFWQDMGDSQSDDVFEVGFNGDIWIAADYPWGSYQSEGIFAPRYNANMENYYNEMGFRNTPKKVKVNFNNFSSVAQVMFTQMRTTKELTINVVNGQYFGCHDVVGMFEADTELETLNINGEFRWGDIRTCLYMFDGCQKLTAIPYDTNYPKTHPYNILFPRTDEYRGTANVARILNGCSALTSFGPVFNFSAISRSGCTWDGRQQDATTTTIFDCPNLTDIWIKGLGHNSWNFADNSTGTYIPKISADSIDYMLQNVQTVSGLTLTLPSLNKDDVTTGFISYAQDRGWTIVWA